MVQQDRNNSTAQRAPNVARSQQYNDATIPQLRSHPHPHPHPQSHPPPQSHSRSQPCKLGIVMPPQPCKYGIVMPPQPCKHSRQ